MTTSPDTPTPAPRRAFHSPAAWATLLLVFGVGLTADLWTKAWSFRTIAGVPVTWDREYLLAHPEWNPIPRHEPKTAVPGRLLNFRLVINRGAVFGIGQQKRGFFIAFTGVAIAVGMLLFARWTLDRHRLAHVALGLILAGGVGNLYDRWQHGAVRDFLHMLPDRHLPFGWSWPGGADELFPWVFNVADVLLLVGMGLMMLHINRSDARRRREQAVEPREAPGASDQRDDQSSRDDAGRSARAE
ncbi:MAG: signal peptidase II [Phycisphaeraceae bacterium]|nr:MAG: signal peptidase II [Phycisphaeraceae bacterium]